MMPLTPYQELPDYCSDNTDRPTRKSGKGSHDLYISCHEVIYTYIRAAQGLER